MTAVAFFGDSSLLESLLVSLVPELSDTFFAAGFFCFVAFFATVFAVLSSSESLELVSELEELLDCFFCNSCLRSAFICC